MGLKWAGKGNPRILCPTSSLLFSWTVFKGLSFNMYFNFGWSLNRHCHILVLGRGGGIGWKALLSSSLSFCSWKDPATTYNWYGFPLGSAWFPSLPLCYISSDNQWRFWLYTTFKFASSPYRNRELSSGWCLCLVHMARDGYHDENGRLESEFYPLVEQGISVWLNNLLLLEALCVIIGRRAVIAFFSLRVYC